MSCTVEYFSGAVVADYHALAADLKARLNRIIALTEAIGLERTKGPYVKHLEGPVGEMRMSGKDGIARAA